MGSILRCNYCGGSLRVMGKFGAYLSTDCPNCGMTSQPLISNQMREQHRERNTVEVVRRRGRQRAVPVPSEPPPHQ